MFGTSGILLSHFLKLLLFYLLLDYLIQYIKETHFKNFSYSNFKSSFTFKN